MKYLIIKPYQLIISLLLTLSIINNLSVKAKPPHIIKGINVGVYEKGPYFGIFSDLGKKNQFEIGLNYLDIPIGKYDAGFSKNIQANLSFAGLRLLFRRYLDTTDNNGFYTQFGLEANRMAARTNIELSNMSYKTNKVTIFCPTCHSMDLSIKPNIFPFIPSISLGWQSKISSKIALQASIGLQYKKIGKASWEYNSNNKLPVFVREEINNAIEKVNTELNNLPNIFPTIMITVSRAI